VSVVRSEEAANGPFDLILFGNESADTGGYQVGIRVAVALDRPIVTGIKGLEARERSVVARRDAGGGAWESFELDLPAVVAVKEGINLPRYPSLKGRLAAKKAQIEVARPEPRPSRLEKIRLVVPQEERRSAEFLPDAARVVEVLRELGLVAS
jgi:electron transfer flavoprotein beta subunit